MSKQNLSKLWKFAWTRALFAGLVLALVVFASCDLGNKDDDDPGKKNGEEQETPDTSGIVWTNEATVP